MASSDVIQSRMDGLAAARRTLEAVMRAERAAIPGALTKIGQQAVTEIRRRAPLLTGRLRRSYAYEVGKGWVEVSTNVSYAPEQEFGTVHQPGTPHVRPGVEAVIGKVPLLVAAAMGAAGRAAGAGGGSGAAGRVSRIVGAL